VRAASTLPSTHFSSYRAGWVEHSKKNREHIFQRGAHETTKSSSADLTYFYINEMRIYDIKKDYLLKVFSLVRIASHTRPPSRASRFKIWAARAPTLKLVDIIHEPEGSADSADEPAEIFMPSLLSSSCRDSRILHT
jgi:hypothetical protein